MYFRDVVLLVLLGSLPSLGCQMLASSATTRLAEDVSAAVLDQEDAALVRDGAPAYLIAIDGLIEGDPNNQTLLLAGARLYAAYASAFVVEEKRARLLTGRAKDYGHRALCQRRPAVCEATIGPFEEFEATLREMNAQDLPALYGFGSAWATWIQVNASDWNAIADLPKVQVLMERIVALDGSYEDGGAHLYLGVLYCLRPASMGGKPELGREHFERAIALSDGENLMAKVLFASQYARLIFDRPLHDQLLKEVLAADPRAHGFTLTNTLAQDRASELLQGSDDFF